MAEMTYQRRDRQALNTRLSVHTPRHSGGKVLEDNRAAFKAQQEAQLKKDKTGLESHVDGNIDAAAVSADNAQVQLKAGVPVNDDKSLEHEADTMGQKALQMRANINGKSPAAESQESMHGNSDAPPQLSSAEETAQLKESRQPEIAQREQAPAKPNNTGLPDNLKNGIESLSGISMDNVKVHYNSSQPAQLNALAYAQGTDIHVAPGQERHLPHEAWHVVQQAQGRVRPTMQMKETAINNDAGLEAAADGMNGKLDSAESQEPPIQTRVSLDSDQPIQMIKMAGNGGWLDITWEDIVDFRAAIIAKLNSTKGKALSSLNQHKFYTFDTAGLEFLITQDDLSELGWLESKNDKQQTISGHGALLRDKKKASDSELYGHFKNSVQTGILHPSLIEDHEEEYEPTQEELRNLAEDYGYEAGEAFAKTPALNDAPTDAILLDFRFRDILSEEPILEPYYEQFVQGFHEGMNDIREEIKEFGIENYPQWENDLAQEELQQLIEDQQLYEDFRSDIDEDREPHKVYPKIGILGPIIMVESNPTPLGFVLFTKTWEGVSITGILAQLKPTADKAQDALYNIAGNAAKKIKGSRTKSNMLKFKKTLRDISLLLAKVSKITNSKGQQDLPETDLSQSMHYGQDASPTEGLHVKAFPLSLNSPKAGSSPHDGRLMTSMRALAGPDHKSYVQMHLLNDLVSGPGVLWNLTPGPKKSNSEMEQKVEDPLKRAIIAKGLVINFEAIVNYKEDPNGANLKDINQNADRFRFTDIKFKATQLEFDGTTSTWKTASSPDTDVAAVDNAKVNWKYGSLIPLKPKPKILDKTTTEQDLKDAGINDATAKRIVNFVNNAPLQSIKDITGENKKEKLAAAIKAFDKRKTKPNMSGWKATEVLWT